MIPCIVLDVTTNVRVNLLDRDVQLIDTICKLRCKGFVDL